MSAKPVSYLYIKDISSSFSVPAKGWVIVTVLGFTHERMKVFLLLHVRIVAHIRAGCIFLKKDKYKKIITHFFLGN